MNNKSTHQPGPIASKQLMVFGGILLALGVLWVIYSTFFSGSNEPTPEEITPIDTTFNQDTRDDIAERRNDIPSIFIEGIGRDNPFAPIE